ncbi:hypothetical protein [Sutcliffiella horikoshii]|uniref:hypothetical protein n=1 Tax=Sutcliffiella horikoshii TaxID=79883 RepID=UPI001F35D92F|nr:hypothetical protein [Sutcliffiella horikoshii]MCG1023631.1 hypothetical protein [Sutcliffiella horikoshii]
MREVLIGVMRTLAVGDLLERGTHWRNEDLGGEGLALEVLIGAMKTLIGRGLREGGLHRCKEDLGVRRYA